MSNDVTRDESFNILQAMHLANEQNNDTPDSTSSVAPSSAEVSKNTPADDGYGETDKAEKPMSALDRAMAAKKKVSSGFIDTEEDAATENAPLRPGYDTDEDRENMKHKLQELDDDVKKAQSVYVVKRPTNEAEYADMITEVSSVQFDENDLPIVPEGARYIVPKTPEIVAKVEAMKAAEAEATSNGSATPTENIPQDMDEAKKSYKDNVVKILIDKTGMGANIKFDNEENKVIELGNIIQLYEVEDEELRVVDVERPDDATPFMQAVEAKQLSIAKAPMIFPASGFKAEMRGLSYGEFADITLDTEPDDDGTPNADMLNFDKLYKRYSVVYNAMKNISVGPFKDFDSFLHNFAHDDLPLALYGLVITTQPEKDSLYLNCTQPNCRKRFLFNYQPRSVLDLDRSSTTLLNMIAKISDAAPDQRYEIYKNSRVRKFKRIRLPYSKYLVDIGMPSAWDYLYQILPIVKEYAEMEDGLDELDPRNDIPMLLQGVRNIYVEKVGGGHVRTKTARDIVDAILSLPTGDVLVLKAAVEAYRAQYRIHFSLKSIECPYCHTKTDSIPLTIDQLVFQLRLHQMSYRATVKNFPDF